MKRNTSLGIKERDEANKFKRDALNDSANGGVELYKAMMEFVTGYFSVPEIDAAAEVLSCNAKFMFNENMDKSNKDNLKSKNESKDKQSTREIENRKVIK